MGTILELLTVLKVSFSGIFNVITLVGILFGIILYGLIWKISVRYEGSTDIDCVMDLIGLAEIYLGTFKNRFTRMFAVWLWAKIIKLDLKKRLRLAMYTNNEEYQIWLIRQLACFKYDKKIESIFQFIISREGFSKQVMETAKICSDEIKQNN